FLDPFGGFFFRTPANLADHDDSMCFRVVHEHLEHIEVRGAIDWIAADADAGGLANATAGQLPNRFVRESAASRDHTDMAFLVNVPRRDSNPAAALRIFAFTRRDE